MVGKSEEKEVDAARQCLSNDSVVDHDEGHMAEKV
jgi:hypothetical protein